MKAKVHNIWIDKFANFPASVPFGWGVNTTLDLSRAALSIEEWMWKNSRLVACCLVTWSPPTTCHFFSEEISRWPAPQSDTSMFFLLNVKGDYGWKSQGYWLSDNPPIIHLPPGTYCKADIGFLGKISFSYLTFDTVPMDQEYSKESKMFYA